MEKMSIFKKLLILVVLLAVALPAGSLSEWACEKYATWATANPESDTAPWLLFNVARIHALMDRKDKAAETYSSFYETYKKPFDEIDDEDPRVAEARYEQAMCYYDRQPLGEEDAALAHKYFTYFLDRYDGTGKADPEKIKKAADFRAQILMDFYQAAKWFWAAEGSANYEP